MIEEEEIENYVEGKKRYGEWGGNPRGFSENPTYCFEEVYSTERFRIVPHQCRRKRGYGPKGLFCKQHARRYGN